MIFSFILSYFLKNTNVFLSFYHESSKNCVKRYLKNEETLSKIHFLLKIPSLYCFILDVYVFFIIFFEKSRYFYQLPPPPPEKPPPLENPPPPKPPEPPPALFRSLNLSSIILSYALLYPLEIAFDRKRLLYES